MNDRREISDEELRRRVVRSLLSAAVRLSRVFGVSLKELIAQLESAYFHELRSGGLTQREIAEALGVSQRTAVRLSKQSRESFFLPEIMHSLPLRIEFILGSRPMGEARIVQVLPDATLEMVRGALRQLLGEGRIRERQGRTLMYETVTNVRRLPRDNWMARVGALGSFMENLTNATYGRFFKGERRAFARSIRFEVPPGEVARLRALYEDTIIPALTVISDEGERSEEGEAMQLSLCWAPYEYISSDEGSPEQD